jgi:hypothetical protein
MIKHVDFDDYGFLTGTSVTGSYQTLLTLTDDVDVLFVFNTCDKSLLLQVPSKALKATSTTTKEIRLPVNASFVIDCRTNDKRIAKGIIKVKHAGVVPTTGEISITACR